jgi:16S rRNA processing protein RimM
VAGTSGSGQDEYLIVARVRRPHGVRGELLVAIDTDRPRHVFRPGRVLHLADARGDPTGRSITLEGARPTTGGMILRIRGVSDREGADELRGRVLLIAGADAQPADLDEVHYRDLVGLTAIADGEVLGEVRDIVEMPTVELLVVRRQEGKEVLVPFVREIVRGVDLERRELDLALPEGFLEI